MTSAQVGPPPTHAELEHDLGGSGRLGDWLWTRFASLPLPDFRMLGGVWRLGDSPSLLVTALGDESSTFTTTPASAEVGRGASTPPSTSG